MTENKHTTQTRTLQETLTNLFDSLEIELVDVVPADGATAADIQIEYEHTQTGSEALKQAILSGVTVSAIAVSGLSPTPTRVDVTARSPVDEPPLDYHLTRNQVTRAAVAYARDNDELIEDLFVEVAANADRFVDVADVRT